MNTKTHWKKLLNYKYYGTYSLKPNQEETLTIKTVSKENIIGAKGKKSVGIVARFNEKLNGEDKPMILNKTNCKIIELLHGSPFIEDWVGKQITIYAAKGIEAFGSTVDALRIRITDKQIINASTKNNEIVKKWIGWIETATKEDLANHADQINSNNDDSVISALNSRLKELEKTSK